MRKLVCFAATGCALLVWSVGQSAADHTVWHRGGGAVASLDRSATRALRQRTISAPEIERLRELLAGFETSRTGASASRRIVGGPTLSVSRTGMLSETEAGGGGSGGGTDRVEQGLVLAATAGAAAQAYGAAGGTAVTEIFGGGAAAAGGGAAGAAVGVVSAGLFGYLVTREYINSTESGATAGSWWGSEFADTALGQAISSFFWGTPDPSGGDPDDTGAQPGAAGGPDATGADGDPGTTDTAANEGGDSGGEDGGESGGEDGGEDGGGDGGTACAGADAGSCDENDDAGTDDGGSDTASAGPEPDSTPNPEHVDVPDALVAAFLQTPLGRSVLRDVERAAQQAISGGLLPPPDGTNGRELLVELIALFPALGEMLARAELRLVAEAVAIAKGGSVSTPADGDELPTFYVVSDDQVATYLIVSGAIDYPEDYTRPTTSGPLPIGGTIRVEN